MPDFDIAYNWNPAEDSMTGQYDGRDEVGDPSRFISVDPHRPDVLIADARAVQDAATHVHLEMQYVLDEAFAGYNEAVQRWYDTGEVADLPAHVLAIRQLCEEWLGTYASEDVAPTKAAFLSALVIACDALAENAEFLSRTGDGRLAGGG